MFLWQLIVSYLALNAGRKSRTDSGSLERSDSRLGESRNQMQPAANVPLPNPHGKDLAELFSVEYLVKDEKTLTPIEAVDEGAPHAHQTQNAKIRASKSKKERSKRRKGIKTSQKSQKRSEKEKGSNALRVRVVGHSEDGKVVVIGESIEWGDLVID